MRGKRYRKASEIGEFVYCHKAWWLHHIRSNAPANREVLEAGRVHHARHGAQVQQAAWVRKAAVVLVGVAILLLIGGALGWL